MVPDFEKNTNFVARFLHVGSILFAMYFPWILQVMASLKCSTFPNGSKKYKKSKFLLNISPVSVEPDRYKVINKYAFLL